MDMIFTSFPYIFNTHTRICMTQQVLLFEHYDSFAFEEVPGSRE